MPIMDHFSVAVFPWGRKPPTMNEVVEAAQYAEKLGFYSVAGGGGVRQGVRVTGGGVSRV